MILKSITIIIHHLINNNYYNFYHDTFDFRNNGHISLSQQTDITNSTIETNTQTTNYIDNTYPNNNKIATIILNPTPSLTENCLWIPEGITDNVVPGLDRILTYTQTKYATLTALQNSKTNLNSTINNEISNIQTEIHNVEITNQQNISKDLHYNTTHTYYTFQRNNTIHKYDTHRSYITQQNYFTYQRKGNQELQIEILNTIVADIQNQINNISKSNQPPDDNGDPEPEIGYA